MVVNCTQRAVSLAILLMILPVFLSQAQALTFHEAGGLVVMEAESTESPLGKWVKRTDNKGYTGAGHLEFTGNSPTNGPANSPLEYSFKITKAGDYRLYIRARKRLEGEPSDHCNDGYVRLEGDFTAGSNSAPLSLLRKNTKFFGGSANGWGWAAKLDQNHKKYSAVYKLKTGQVYTLVLSGRSQRWNIDRIVFRHSSVSEKDAQKTSNPESSRDDSSGGRRTGRDTDPPTTPALPPLKGRIAVSTDGNQHDKDDYAATALTCAILDAAGLNNQLVHYDYGNHLGDNNSKMEQEMIVSALGGADRFGLNTKVFYNDQEALNAAIANFRTQGNASSADNPLWFICGGPMEVAWRCCNAVTPSKRQYITCISHSNWNNKHDDTSQMSHDWDDLLKLGVKTVRIADQNGELHVAYDRYHWLRDSENPNWRWLWDRLKATGKPKADPSDAGMAYWLVTGGIDGGNEYGTPEDLEELLAHPVKRETDAPTPNPPTWRLVPQAVGENEIQMSATPGKDASTPVQYRFEEITDACGAKSSEWQEATSYRATGLAPGRAYIYRFKMRDRFGNESEWSDAYSVTTQGQPDSDPPSPTSAGFHIAPKALGKDSITMTAITGSDRGTVWYYFKETSGHKGGSDSGWQTSPNFTDTDLEPDTLYTYTVKMKDNSCNEGQPSAPASARTDESLTLELDFTPNADAYLEGSKGYNNETLRVQASGPPRVSYLRFDVADFPSGYEVEAVTLELTENGDKGSGTLRFHKATAGSWSEEGFNESQAPPVGDEIGLFEGSVGSGQTVQVDVTPLLTTAGLHTIVIKMDNGGNDIWFGSRESKRPPKLLITLEKSAGGRDRR